MSDTRKKIPLLILGAGMAGLGAGIEARRRGINSLILEADTRVGGLCKNATIRGCDFDFGPKILILDDSANSKDMLSFLGDNYEKYPMQESVYLNKFGLLGFPLQRNLIDLPKNERKIILSEIDSIKDAQHVIKSYRDWLTSNYGKYLSENILIPYEEKKWQTSLDNLDYEWALSRPVRVAFDEIKQGAYKKLPPSKYYYYPKVGNISVVSQNMAKAAGQILLDSSVDFIDLTHKYVEANGKRFYYDKLVSTMPLDYELSITQCIDPSFNPKSEILKRLAIRVFNLVFKGNFDLNGTAIYFPEKEYIFRRISILQNLCPALGRDGLTPISVEVSLDLTDEKLSQQDMEDAVVRQLHTIPQFAQLGSPISSQILEVDFAYPLQTKGLRSFVKDIHEVYRRYDVYHCGRGGNFDYCNSDLAYKQGKDIVASIV